jgi:ATP-dependent DNA helicase DinG
MTAAFPWDAVGLARCDVLSGGERRRVIDGRLHGLPPDAEDRVPLVVYGASDSAPASGEESRTDAIDVKLLARSLFPTLGDHRLEGVARALGIAGLENAPHELILEILAHALSRAAQISPDHLALLQRLLSPPTGQLLHRAEERAATLAAYAPVADPTISKPTPAEDLHAVDAAFAPTGPIARDLPGFELRDGQLGMAQWVETCLGSKRSLAVEAGPGTGKTFAYLVPLLLRLQAHAEERAIVSTRTRQLQEQLFFEDLPFLAQRLAPATRIALLKGRDNYVCLRRWEQAVVELAGGLDRELAQELAPVATWLEESTTGDIEENAAFLSGPSRDRLWPQIRDDGRHCVASVCPFVGDCFSLRARRRAQRAQLVVVNHALLLSDAQIGRRILGAYDLLVIDEAHALEGAARDAFTHTLSRRALDALSARIGTARGPRTGWLRRAAAELDEPSRRAIRHAMGTVRRSGARLFRRLEEILPEAPRALVTDLTALDPVAEPHREDSQGLQNAFRELPEIADEELRVEKEILGAEIRAYGDLQQLTLSPPPENTVRWSERSAHGSAVHLSPLEVHQPLAELLYADLRSLILTSATLSPRDDHAFLRNTLGLDRAPGGLLWYDAEPAIPYRDRMRIYTPRYLPPIEGDLELHADGVAALIARLLQAFDRKMLVLFTSYQMLRAVHRRLPQSHSVFAQRPSEGRSQLLERLRTSPHGAVLLGADSFWEGVDLPGAELELLVVTRLPFPVPSDPIYSALAERLRQRGEEPFHALALPRAAVKLRQGVGRLLRTVEDHGAVVVTDDRLFRKPYGASLVRSLPIAPEPVASETDLVEALERWFAPRAVERSL